MGRRYQDLTMQKQLGAGAPQVDVCCVYIYKLHLVRWSLPSSPAWLPAAPRLNQPILLLAHPTGVADAVMRGCLLQCSRGGHQQLLVC